MPLTAYGPLKGGSHSGIPARSADVQKKFSRVVVKMLPAHSAAVRSPEIAHAYVIQ